MPWAIAFCAFGAGIDLRTTCPDAPERCPGLSHFAPSARELICGRPVRMPQGDALGYRILRLRRGNGLRTTCPGSRRHRKNPSRSRSNRDNTLEALIERHNCSLPAVRCTPCQLHIVCRLLLEKKKKNRTKEPNRTNKRKCEATTRKQNRVHSAARRGHDNE